MTSDNMLRKSLEIILGGGHENQRKDGITRHLYREAKDHTFTTVIGFQIKLQICCVQKDITVRILITERLYMCLRPRVEKQLQHNGTRAQCLKNQWFTDVPLITGCNISDTTHHVLHQRSQS